MKDKKVHSFADTDEKQLIIRQEEASEVKSRIARSILEALPEWFGIRESR